MNKYIGLFITGACLLFSVSTTSAAEPSIRDLDKFIGKWTFTDEATKLAGFEYKESGEIECRYDLDDTYIRCDNVGRHNGKERRYVNYINYNSISGTFELVGIFGNFPEKSFFSLKPLNDFTQFELAGRPMRQRSGLTSKNYGVITFKDANHFTWETRLNKSNEAPNHWPLKFIGTYQRASDE